MIVIQTTRLQLSQFQMMEAIFSSRHMLYLASHARTRLPLGIQSNLSDRYPPHFVIKIIHLV